MFYNCAPCGAFVGVHEGTLKPLGVPAVAEHRKAKSAAHRAFDPLWRSKEMSRTEAYAWLALVMNMTKKDCHIGKMSIQNCLRVTVIMEKYYEQRNPS
jgi:hypothetical protein